MKKITTLLTMLVISSSAFAGSLRCDVSKGFKQPKSDLVQTAFAYQDPEEETESYVGSLNETVIATVEYAPYQNGINLKLELVNTGVFAEANFDQETDDYINLSITDTDGSKYLLVCRK